MTRLAANALIYWAAIFALGFVLGIVRTLWLAPVTGVFAAVLIELPVMLAAAWLAARLVLRRSPLPTRSAALAMGALAFALLLGAELLTGMLALDQTPRQWLAGLASPPGLAGLAGQVVFGLLPSWVWPLRQGRMDYTNLH